MVFDVTIVYWSLKARSASALVGRKFAPISDRMRVYRLVREIVDAKRFTTLKDLTEELRPNGYTLPSRETIKHWVRGETSPFSGKRIFDSLPSEELSFFLGAWIGDGWSDESDGGKRMLLKVRSYDFAREFAEAAAKILHKTDTYWVRRIRDETGMWYLVKVTSFMLYDFVNQPLEALRTSIEPFPKGFLRGFFTAEGNPSVSIQQRGPTLDVGVALSNSDSTLLEFSRSLLETLGFHTVRIRLNRPEGKRTNLGVATKPNWLMTISRFDDIRKFAEEIGFGDSTKQRKLIDALSLRSEHGRAGAANRWTKLYEKYQGDWVRRARN